MALNSLIKNIVEAQDDVQISTSQDKGQKEASNHNVARSARSQPLSAKEVNKTGIQGGAKHPAAKMGKAPIYTTISSSGERQKKYAESESMLIALAAMQIRYGHCQEAVAYLMFVRKNNPRNENAIRLLANALIKLKRLDQAELLLNELEVLASDKNTKGVYLLYRSLVKFHQAKISEARNWFQKFRIFRRGSLV